MQKNVKNAQKILTISIIVVALLLILNLFLLFFLNGRRVDTAGADGNVIGETQAAELPAQPTGLFGLRATPVPMRLLSARTSEKISLNLWNGYDGEKPFEVTGMLPGDSETKVYKVAVRKKDAVALSFAADITENSALSDGLIFTVVANDVPLYHGALSQMPTLSVDLTSGSASQEVVYKITVELPVSANNDYARLSLAVNFLWTLSENEPEETTTEPEETTTEPEETTTEPEETTTEPEETTSKPEETTTEPEETTKPKPEETTRPTPPVTEPVFPGTYPDLPDITEPEETTTEPEETTLEPPEITTEPEETTLEPPEITTVPEETTSVPPETVPPETGPVTPVIPEPCKECLIDRVIENFFGHNGDRCVICDAVTSLFSEDELICICPIGCLIVILICIIAIVVTVTLIVRRVLKREDDDEEENETENDQ